MKHSELLLLGKIFYILQNHLKANDIPVKFHETYELDTYVDNVQTDTGYSDVTYWMDEAEIIDIDNGTLELCGDCVEHNDATEVIFKLPLVTAFKLTNLYEVLLEIVIKQREKDKEHWEKLLATEKEINMVIKSTKTGG